MLFIFNKTRHELFESALLSRVNVKSFLELAAGLPFLFQPFYRDGGIQFGDFQSNVNFQHFERQRRGIFVIPGLGF